MLSVIKNTGKAAVFTAGLAGLLTVTSFVVQPKDNSEDDGIHDGLANGILAEPDETIDVLVVGDSEVYAAIMPLRMWEKQGITAYACGTGAQKLGYTFDFVRKNAETQSPDVVVLETNTLYRELSYDDVLYNRAEGLFPFFAYHSRWKSVTKRDLNPAVEYTHVSETKGYSFSEDIVPADDSGYMTVSDEKEPIQSISRTYVKKISDFCKKNGSELILLSTPSTLNWNYPRHNSVQELADEIGASYIDMNILRDEVPIDWQTDTKDSGDHMNYTGAVKVSDYLGSYLIETGKVRSHKGDKAYSQWDKAAEEFNNTHKHE